HSRTWYLLVLFLLVCPAGLRQRMPGIETGFRKYQKADARQRGKNAYRGRARHEARTLFMKTE
ncbi:hypothetical protein KUT65_37855, partial [Pseudomonas aeruginosa]|nr:hypothetical protein [Pseudomonas aeruginosa]